MTNDNTETFTPTTHDLLLYAVVVGAGGTNLAQGAVCGSREIGPSAWAMLVTVLESTAQELLQLVGGEDGLDTNYSAGHPVYTMLQLDCGCVWVQAWHPVPDHPRNAPQELAVSACERGGTHRFMVAALGVLDAVTES